MTPEASPSTARQPAKPVEPAATLTRPGRRPGPAPRRTLRWRAADRVVAAAVISGMELIRRMPDAPLWWLGNTAGNIEYWATKGRRDEALAAYRRRRRLINPALCRTCGYDLRASKERCPECGCVVTKFNEPVMKPPE